MSTERPHIHLKDISSRTFLLEMDDTELGEMTINAPCARNGTVILSDGRRLELSYGGEDLKGYVANEDGRRRALMLVSNIVRSGKVFTASGTDYLVELSQEPYSQMALSRQGGRPGVMVLRSCPDSTERIQSHVRLGDFGREELITLLSLAAFYLLSKELGR